MAERSNTIYRKQKRTLILILLCFGLVVSGFLYYMLQGDHQVIPVKQNTDLPLDKMDPQAIMLMQIESQNQILSQRLKYLEEVIIENQKREETKELQNSQLQKEISQLRRDIKETENRHIISNSQKIKEIRKDPLLDTTKEVIKNRERFLFTEIVATASKERVHHVDKMIPAGTTVKAILLSSVDAPCGVFSCSDPQPVKLRILDNGHLPKAVRARLKGGLVIASVYGDLSNERVYMRLERLSQIKCNGTFIETGITGFVTGEDGKYGVRGVVADKSYKLVENAALSGIFSGISSYFQSTARIRNYNVNELNPPFSAAACGTEGGIRGACSAFDMLTDYFIKRAEQIRPVIQVTAGRVVDITFTHSAELGDLYTKEQIKEIRNTTKEK
jgi:conjugal transfer pilus assembly protein TraB